MKRPLGETIAGLFQQHASALLLYARQWVGTAAADDVVQRVFVRLQPQAAGRSADVAVPLRAQ